jgi:hypothetical protein
MKKNCVWLACALILSASVQAWPDSVTGVQTSVSIPNANTTDSPPCSPNCPTMTSAMSLLVNSGGTGNASASAAFGTLDAASSIAGDGGADASATFRDSLSVLSGSSGTGTFQIAFVTTGTTVSAVGDADASVFLEMKVATDSFLTGLSGTFDVFDSSTSGITTSGLPITVFNIDASDGETIMFFAEVFADSSSFSSGSAASAIDPVSVFITPPTGFSFTTSSGATYSPTPSSVPEPSSLLLLSAGLACLGACGRKMLIRM